MISFDFRGIELCICSWLRIFLLNNNNYTYLQHFGCQVLYTTHTFNTLISKCYILHIYTFNTLVVRCYKLRIPSTLWLSGVIYFTYLLHFGYHVLYTTHTEHMPLTRWLSGALYYTYLKHCGCHVLYTTHTFNTSVIRCYILHKPHFGCQMLYTTHSFNTLVFRCKILHLPSTLWLLGVIFYTYLQHFGC